MNATDVILVDTGPLVALIDRSEAHHLSCLQTIKELPTTRPLATVPAVLTEAFYLLQPHWQLEEKLFQLLDNFCFQLLPTGIKDLARIHELMEKYRDTPMDFADASVVVAAERNNIKTIFTLDRRDFNIYRPSHTKQFSLLPKIR